MKDDPVLERIWETRRRIAERYDYDPKKMGEHYRELQKRYQSRLGKTEPAMVKEQTPPYKASNE